MKHPDIIEKMDLEEKAKFVSGFNYWHLESDEALGLPDIMITDGPHGLRKQNPNGDSVGLGNSYPATCMPTAATSSCSWDEDLLKREGEALAEECLKEKVSVILGPGTNIKRSPVCGRNFEYFSEDPLLAGKMAAAMINGCQSKGIGNSLKHFACNSQEAYRMVINEVIDERALREIYLTAFEIAIKEAQPWTVMNSYNRINGVYASQNEWLLNKVARDEWGFEGLYVTDWGASVDRIDGLKTGTDLEMPSSGTLNTEKIIAAVKNGELDEEILNERVDNVVDLIMKSKPVLEEEHTYDVEAHHQLACEIAENSMVLLKNDDNILPLKEGQHVAVIGELAKLPRYQGAGSSVINPTKEVENAYDNLVKAGVDVVYAQGYYKAPAGKKDKNRKSDEALIEEARIAAKGADVVLLFIGLTEEYEAEGYDRENIELPAAHNTLVQEVLKENPNVVVVLAGGSVVEMPWVDDVKGILNSGLGGQASGMAVSHILTGAVNPSGKTSETYPVKFEDNPVYGNYPGQPIVSEHKESIYIGYRYYDTAKKDVLFPFGYGLSYTTFEYSGMKLSDVVINDDETVDVSLTVKNTGDVDGAEVVEIYVGAEEGTIFRPEKELRAFKKVFLKAGESKEVTFTLGKRAFAYFNVELGDWHVESGIYEIMAGASSRDIRLSAKMRVHTTVETEIPDYRESAPAYYTADLENMTGEQWATVYGKDVPSNERDKSKRIDLYSCLDDASHTKWGGKICRLIKKIMSKMGSAENGDGAMLEAMALQIPIRNFVAMSCGVFSPKMAEGLLKILNDDTSTFVGFNIIFWRLGGALTRLPALLKTI